MPVLFITDLDLPVKVTTQKCTQVMQELTTNRKFNAFHGFLVFTDGIPPAITLLKYTTLQIRKPAVNHDSEPVTSMYNSHNTYPSLSGFGFFFFVCVDSELHELSEKR